MTESDHSSLYKPEAWFVIERSNVHCFRTRKAFGLLTQISWSNKGSVCFLCMPKYIFKSKPLVPQVLFSPSCVEYPKHGCEQSGCPYCASNAPPAGDILYLHFLVSKLWVLKTNKTKSTVRNPNRSKDGQLTVTTSTTIPHLASF